MTMRISQLKHAAIFLVLLGLGQIDASFAQSANPREIEISSIDLEREWMDTLSNEFPVAAFKAFPKDTLAELKEDERSASFLFVDLNGDGKNEIIVNDPTGGGSGGAYYLVLRQVGKKWKLIGGFQGGFILTLRDDRVKYQGDFYRIISYYRSGDTYETIHDFKNGTYHITDQVMMPRAITDSCWWQIFWLRLNGSSERTAKNTIGTCKGG